jgi:hypothetical protein
MAQPNSTDDKGDQERQLALSVISVGIFFGIAAIVAYASQSKDLFVSVVAVGIAMAGASFLIGTLLGFLFGIPRRLQHESAAKSTKEGGNGDDEKSGSLIYGANTNLEQISDWLTKILVGVGLTQISGIRDLLRDVGDFSAPGLGGLPSSSTFAIAVVLYFLVGGFLLGYLWTRISLGRYLTEAELASTLKKRLTALEEEIQANARALTLCGVQLDEEARGEVTQEELNAAVEAASKAVRSHIFYKAQLNRWRNWQTAKPAMERSIPIFRALINSDTKNEYHLNHGQLGFALKDKQQPDWAAADAELTQAIDMRGHGPESDWRSYEFNRAICRIMQDSRFNANEVSDPDVKDRILADLTAADKDTWVRSWMRDEPTINRWLKKNNVHGMHLAKTPA